MATGLYPGKGSQLYKASSNAQEPAWDTSTQPSTPVATIPSGSSSLGVPLNAGLTTSVNVLYGGTAPSGTAFNIMYDVDPTFATEYVYQAVASVSSQKVYTWSTAGMVELDGFIRITNAGSQDITKAWVQQRAATVG